MKLTSPRNALSAALSVCAAVAEKSGAAFATSCVLFDARDGGLKLSASDGNSNIRTTVHQVQIEARGYLGCNARDALDRVKAMPDTEIVVEEKAGSIQFRAGKRKHTVKALPGTEFPAFPEPVAAEPVMVPVERLAWLLARTVHAASLDTTRPNCHGVALSSAKAGDGWELHCGATDGRQMAYAKVAVAERIPDALVALKSVQTIQRLCVVEGSVGIRVSGGRMLLSIGSTEYAILLVADTPPPMQTILASCKVETEAVVPRLAMLDAARSVSLGGLKVEGDKGFRGMKLTFSEGGLLLNGEEAEDSVACSVTGPGVVLGMRSDLLIGALDVLEGIEVRIGIDNDLQPVLFRSVDAQSGDAQLILMPWRL